MAAGASRMELVRAASLAVAALALYLPFVAGAAFLWDDDAHALFDEPLRGLAGLWRIWFQPGASQQFYPLTYTSFWLEFHTWGLWAPGGRLLNALLHAANGVLLWRMLERLKVPGAWWGALLFLLHPINVESVAWISERKNVLSFFWSAAAALFFLRHVEPRDEERPAKWPLAASLACFFLALASKTVACMLVPVLLLAVWWRGSVGRREAALLAPYFALGLAAALITIYVEHTHVGAAGDAYNFTLLERVVIASRALCHYFTKLLLPTGLVFFYPKFELGVSQPVNIMAVASVLAAAFIALAGARQGWRGPVVVVGGSALFLLPSLGFVDYFPMRFSFVADHFAYFASATACAGIAAGVFRLAEHYTPARGGLPAGVLVAAALAFAALASSYLPRYASHEALYSSIIARNPRAFIAQYNYGRMVAERGDYTAALEHFAAALHEEPRHPGVLLSTGQAWSRLGDDMRALWYYEKSVEAVPEYAPGWANLGNVRWRLGALEQSRAAYERALELAPEDTATRERLERLERALDAP